MNDETHLSDHWRTLTIFVSSTFKDMHVERDCINNHIAPELNARLRPYGVMLRFIDLRWGIITDRNSDESKRESEILKVCFNEIQRSQPLFIGLLGQRYGWVPDAQRRDNIDGEIKRLLPKDDISVTEMEIHIGALANDKVNRHAIFCFRQDTNASFASGSTYCEEEPLAKQKLDRLRSTLRKRIDADRCIDYTPTWANGDIVSTGNFQKDLTAALWREIGEILNLDTGSTLADTTLITDFELQQQRTAKLFVGRHKELKTLTSFALQGQVVALQGPHGCGKSALLCQLATELKQYPTLLPLYYDVACTAETRSPWSMLDYLCRQCAQALGTVHKEVAEKTGVARILGTYAIDEPSLVKLEERLNAYCTQLQHQGKKPILLIDHLDVLHTNRYHTQWHFRPNDVSVIATLDGTAPDGIDSHFIHRLSVDDSRALIHKRLSFHDKQLHPSVEQAALAKAATTDGCINSCWIVTMMHYFLNFDATDFSAILNTDAASEEERIENYCLKLIAEAPVDTVELLHYLVDKAKRVFDADIVDRGMALLCLGRQGFRDQDFERIANGQWDALRFAEFCRWMHPFIAESPHSHQWTMLQPWLATRWAEDTIDVDRQYQHLDIAHLLLGYEPSDPLRRQEAFYHAYMAADWTLCAQLIADLSARETLPVVSLFEQMDNSTLEDTVETIVRYADDKVRPETVGKLFQVVIHNWASSHPMEAGTLSSRCIHYINLDSITEDYDFTCLCELLKDRLLYAKHAADWVHAKEFAQNLKHISSRWERLFPGRGTTGLSIAEMELPTCESMIKKQKIKPKNTHKNMSANDVVRSLLPYIQQAKKAMAKGSVKKAIMAIAAFVKGCEQYARNNPGYEGKRVEVVGYTTGVHFYSQALDKIYNPDYHAQGRFLADKAIKASFEILREKMEPRNAINYVETVVSGLFFGKSDVVKENLDYAERNLIALEKRWPNEAEIKALREQLTTAKAVCDDFETLFRSNHNTEIDPEALFDPDWGQTIGTKKRKPLPLIIAIVLLVAALAVAVPVWIVPAVNGGKAKTEQVEKGKKQPTRTVKANQKQTTPPAKKKVVKKVVKKKVVKKVVVHSTD